MSAFIKGHEILAGGLDIIDALYRDMKQVNGQTNVSIANTAQLGFTHYGSCTFSDAPQSPQTMDNHDVFVFTLSQLGGTGANYQFLLQDGYGGRIWFRTGWNNWGSWNKIYDNSQNT